MESSPAVRQEITVALGEIEREQSVKVLYACESGSRAWGFESVNSDWDVRFIYRWPVDAYISLDSPSEQVERSEAAQFGPLDAVGWDISKTLRLLRKSNPSLLEWVHSPLSYVVTQPFTDAFRSFSARAFSPSAAAFHYANFARSNVKDVLSTERAMLKDYFYLLRPVLALRWIADRRSVPPVRFDELLESSSVPAVVAEEVAALTARKRAGEEKELIPRLSALHDFLVGAVMQLDETLSGVRNEGAINPPSTGEWNAFLRAVVAGEFG